MNPTSFENEHENNNEDNPNIFKSEQIIPETTPRVTGNFKIAENKEKFSSNSDSNNNNNADRQNFLQIIKDTLIYKLPLILLMVYIILVNNYVTLIYFTMGILLINLEFENYYMAAANKSPLSTPLREVSNGFMKIEIKFWLYLLLSIASTMLFIAKTLFCFLLMFDPLFISDMGVDENFLKNFDFYLTAHFKTRDVLLMLLPNFFFMVIAICLTITSFRDNKSRKMEIRWKLNLKDEFKKLDYINFVIAICFLIAPAFDFNLIGLIFLFWILFFMLFLSLKKIFRKFYYCLYFFYYFIKAFIAVIFFFNYFALIQMYNNNIPIVHNGFFNFAFLGINTFYNLNCVDVNKQFLMIFIKISNKTKEFRFHN